MKDVAFSGSSACCDSDWRDNCYLQLALIVPLSIHHYGHSGNWGFYEKAVVGRWVWSACSTPGGRNLSYHPHVHYYLVPAGGVALDGQTWLPAGKNFLLPVKALSIIFRAKFRDALRETACFADVPQAV